MKSIRIFSHKDLNKKVGIYIIQNIKNCKVYVGSSHNLHVRLNKHKYSLSKNTHENKYFQNAWNKYGEKSFEFFVLEFVKNEKNLLKREDYYIERFQAYKKQYGYNIFQFGTTSKGNRWSDEAREKRKGFGKGKKISEETKRKVSEKLKGKIMSEETRRKIGESSKVPVVMIDKDGKFIREFDSAASASLYLGVTSSTNICHVLTGRLKSCKGYKFVKKYEYDPTKDYSFRRGNTRAYEQYDLEGNYIQTFLSALDIQKYLNKKGKVSPSIAKCCKGKWKTAFGFIWKYKDLLYVETEEFYKTNQNGHRAAETGNQAYNADIQTDNRM